MGEDETRQEKTKRDMSLFRTTGVEMGESRPRHVTCRQDMSVDGRE